MGNLWLLRPCRDGGTEYVCFRDKRKNVEMLEGYHLPPQMPLVKSRQLMAKPEALRCRNHLECSLGYRHGDPLF
ncbi:MAG: hypothetical protein GY914_03500 [Prochlorococcus sp.]|nr:hypothetical protein [Prochlorococcus sp.]